MVGEGAVAAAVPAGVVGRADEVGSRLVAVVVHGLLDAVAVGVELRADVGERVPLRGVLQREGDDVVGPDVDVLRVAEVRHLAHVDVVEDVRRALHVLGGRDTGRRAALVQGGAAGEVERQAEAEADAGLDLAHALQDLLGTDEVDAAELVVVAPVTPGRAVRTLLPRASASFIALYRSVHYRRPIDDARRLRRLWGRAHPRAHRPLQDPAAHPPPRAWGLGGGLRARRTVGRGGRHGVPPPPHPRLPRVDGLPLPPDAGPHARGRSRSHRRGHGRSTASTSP